MLIITSKKKKNIIMKKQLELCLGHFIFLAHIIITIVTTNSCSNNKTEVNDSSFFIVILLRTPEQLKLKIIKTIIDLIKVRQKVMAYILVIMVACFAIITYEKIVTRRDSLKFEIKKLRIESNERIELERLEHGS